MSVRIADSYRITLRAIGQGLETIGVDQFEIELETDSYLVHGFCKQLKPNDMISSSATSQGSRSLWQKLATCVTSSPQRNRTSSPFEFSGLRFNLNNIRRFELKGQAASTNSEGVPDPHRLSQTLRLAGAYLDQKGSHLLRLAWRPGFVALWHEDALHNESKDIFTPEILYDLWVRQFKKRKTVDHMRKKKAANN